MNRFLKILKSIFKWEFLISNIALFLGISFIGLIAFNLSVFDPFKNALKDFNYNDLIYSKLTDNNSNFDTNIVLVNIAHLDRLQLAEQIKIIRSHKPKVIALDGFFSAQRDESTDSVLKNQLCQDDKFIMAVALSDYNTENKTYNKIETSASYFVNGNFGHINLGGDKPKSSTIRKFKPIVQYNDTTVYSISAQIIKKYKPEAFDRLLKRGNEFEIINYTGNYNSFTYFDFDEVLNNVPDLKIIENKIVLMGYIGKYIGDTLDLEDIYFTPVNEEISGRSHPDMYGMVIHANIISMMLSGSFKDVVPQWLLVLLSFFLTYFYIVLHKYTTRKLGKKFAFIKQFINLFLTIIAIYLGFIFYKYLNYSIDTTYFIAPILLYGSFHEYYLVIAHYLNQKYGIKSIYLNN